MQKETPKGDVEKLILQAGGIKSLVGCLHGIASMQKGKTYGFNSAKPVEEAKAVERLCPRWVAQVNFITKFVYCMFYCFGCVYL